MKEENGYDYTEFFIHSGSEAVDIFYGEKSEARAVEALIAIRKLRKDKTYSLVKYTKTIMDI